MNSSKGLIRAQQQSLRTHTPYGTSDQSTLPKHPNNHFVAASSNRPTTTPVYSYDQLDDNQFIGEKLRHRTGNSPQGATAHTANSALVTKVRQPSPVTFNQSNNTLKGPEYHVKFRVHHKLDGGEKICVLGDIEELGNWIADPTFSKPVQSQHILRRCTRNPDFWVSDEPIITKKPHFFYKYRVIRNNEYSEWEQGIDRICQPDLLLADGNY